MRVENVVISHSFSPWLLNTDAAAKLSGSQSTVWIMVTTCINKRLPSVMRTMPFIETAHKWNILRFARVGTKSKPTNLSSLVLLLVGQKTVSWNNLGQGFCAYGQKSSTYVTLVSQPPPARRHQVHLKIILQVLHLLLVSRSWSRLQFALFPTLLTLFDHEKFSFI